MNTSIWKTTTVLMVLAVLSITARGQKAQQKGELRIYHRATQIGTVANRQFKDDKGRVVKTVYYTDGGSFDGPFREELLREQSTQLHSYDDFGCLIKTESYRPGVKLDHTFEFQCFEKTATRRLTTRRDARGTKQVETRHKTTGSSETALYFDQDGTNVVGISGELPTDVDLIHGWGELFGGFACGIAADREKGRQEQLQIHVAVKNVSYDGDPVMISPVLMELKDSGGRIVASKAANRHDYRQQSEGCHKETGQGAPRVGYSQLQQGQSYSLEDQLPPLAPGKYAVTLTFCVSGIPGRLVSNTIQLEVER